MSDTNRTHGLIQVRSDRSVRMQRAVNRFCCWYFLVPVSGSRPSETRMSHVRGPREISWPAFSDWIPFGSKAGTQFAHTRGGDSVRLGFCRMLLIEGLTSLARPAMVRISPRELSTFHLQKTQFRPLQTTSVNRVPTLPIGGFAFNRSLTLSSVEITPPQGAPITETLSLDSNWTPKAS